MKNKIYSSKIKALKQAVTQLQAILKGGKNSLSFRYFSTTVTKIKTLTEELKTIVDSNYLHKILKPAAIALGLSFSVNTQAQNFAEVVVNPFDFVAQENYISPAFADLDGDGDLDIMAGITGNVGEDYVSQMAFFENTGTASNPIFASRVLNPFGINSISEYQLGFPTLADLDGDGDVDLLYCEYYGAVKYYENTGTVTAPNFGGFALNPFGLSALPASTFYFPASTDLDDDGDIDLLFGRFSYEYDIYGENYEQINELIYVENIGTANQANFAAPITNPFGLSADKLISIPAFGDIDNDGDMDLMLSNYSYDDNSEEMTYQYFENIGTTTSPNFSIPINAFIVSEEGDGLSIAQFADIDDDSDDDLFLFAYSYVNDKVSLYYYENLNAPPTNAAPEITENISVFPNPIQSNFAINYKGVISHIQITDLLGKLVYKSNNPPSEIDASTWANGIYLLHLTNNKGEIMVKKLFKE